MTARSRRISIAARTTVNAWRRFASLNWETPSVAWASSSSALGLLRGAPQRLKPRRPELRPLNEHLLIALDRLELSHVGAGRVLESRTKELDPIGPNFETHSLG